MFLYPSNQNKNYHTLALCVANGYLYALSYDRKSVYRISLVDTSQIRQFTPDIERFQMMDCGIYPHRDGGIWTEFLFQATTATGSTENRRTRGIMYEKPKKGEEPIDENGEIVQVDTRKGYYSDDIAHTFGVPMEQYKKETDVKEMDGFVEIAMLTGAREKKGSDSTDDQDKASTGDPEQLSTPTQPDQ